MEREGCRPCRLPRVLSSTLSSSPTGGGEEVSGECTTSEVDIGAFVAALIALLNAASSGSASSPAALCPPPTVPASASSFSVAALGSSVVVSRGASLLPFSFVVDFSPAAAFFLAFCSCATYSRSRQPPVSRHSPWNVVQDEGYWAFAFAKGIKQVVLTLFFAAASFSAFSRSSFSPMLTDR